MNFVKRGNVYKDPVIYYTQYEQEEYWKVYVC